MLQFKDLKLPEKIKDVFIPAKASKMQVGTTATLAWKFSDSQGVVYLSKLREDFVEVTSKPGEIRFPATSADNSWGPPLWKELHEAAWSGKLDLDFLKSWQAKIPQRCACLNHWSRVISKYPFAGDPKLWSVIVHNEINSLLSKPQVTYEQVDKFYATL